MDEKTNWQSLEKNGPITEYNEPFIEQRADPFVCKAADGTYYFTASYPAYDRILLRSSKTLNGLKNAKERQIWVKHEHGLMSCHISILQQVRQRMCGRFAHMYLSAMVIR